MEILILESIVLNNLQFEHEDINMYPPSLVTDLSAPRNPELYMNGKCVFWTGIQTSRVEVIHMSKFKAGTVERESLTTGPPAGIEPIQVGIGPIIDEFSQLFSDLKTYLPFSHPTSSKVAQNYIIYNMNGWIILPCPRTQKRSLKQKKNPYRFRNVRLHN